MSFVFALLLGAIQGILEFLPVSSFGHSVIIERLLGFDPGGAVLFETFLHAGTLIVLLFLFRKELILILTELLGIGLDILGNIRLYFYNRRTGKKLRYAALVTDNNRKAAAMLFITMIPTAILGGMLRNLVSLAARSAMLPGIGLLLTAVFLVVVDLSRAGGDKTTRNAGYDAAMWVGICQGISVFPGISRCALTVGAGLFCGLNRKMAVRYSFLVSIPAVIGALIVEIPRFGDAEITISCLGLGLAGMAAAAIVGYLVIRPMMFLIQNLKFRYFAIYCMLAGAWYLFMNFS